MMVMCIKRWQYVDILIMILTSFCIKVNFRPTENINCYYGSYVFEGVVYVRVTCLVGWRCTCSLCWTPDAVGTVCCGAGATAETG